MQLNPKIQHDEDIAGLDFDNPDINPVQEPESSDTHDEADLIAAEKEQQEITKTKKVTVSESQVISSPGMIKQFRKNERSIVAGCMLAGIMSVVITYFFIVFI